MLPGDTLTYETPVSFDMSDKKDYEIRVKANYSEDGNLSNNESTYTISSPVTDLESLTNGDMKVNVYPNPTSGKFVLEINTEDPKSYYVEIYSESGKKLRERKVQNSTYSKSNFDLSGVDSGIYLIKINNEQLNYITKVLIK
jgi:hypothetical protein